MLHDMDIRKWILAGLLILHIGWIANHMRWVLTDQINPWKLGGYGMYTVPTPAAKLQVYDADFPDTPTLVKTMQFEAAERFTNITRTFRCAPPPPAALLGFFEENGNLIGKHLAFIYTEARFNRDPRSYKRKIQGVLELSWQDERTFIYRSRFCGKEQIQSATLPETASVPSSGAPALPEVPSTAMPEIPSATLP